ncbi:MAG: hypothetical protein LBD67_06975, partial [Candidatus Accumulibacter sp.]|nr:hypothetical protein [Accumulibacter sp.]
MSRPFLERPVLKSAVSIYFLRITALLILGCIQSGIAWSAPTVELTNPPSGQTYVAPASVTLTATATPDAGTTLSKVEYYRGSTRIGSATSPPYTVTWTNAGAGTYSLTAKATGSDNKTTTSSPRSITITANQAPSVELT